jgi:hypothetical protein
MERNHEPFHKGFTDVNLNGFCTESFLIRQESRDSGVRMAHWMGLYREEARKSKW